MSGIYVIFFVIFRHGEGIFVIFRRRGGRARRGPPGRVRPLFLSPPLRDKILYELHDKNMTKMPFVQYSQRGILSYCHATFLTRGISKPPSLPLSSKSQHDEILYRVHGKTTTKTPLKGVFFLFKHIIHLLYNNKIILSFLSRIYNITYFHMIVRMRARARARARETEVRR